MGRTRARPPPEITVARCRRRRRRQKHTRSDCQCAARLLCALAVTAGTLIGRPSGICCRPARQRRLRGRRADRQPRRTASARRSTSATLEAGEPDHGHQSVWYVFKPTESRRVVVELMNGRNLPPVTTVYTGASVSALQRVGQASIHPGARAVRGRRRADVLHRGRDASPPPAKPTPASSSGCGTCRCRPTMRSPTRRPIQIPGKYRGNAADATAELGEDESHSHSLWYRFRPRRTVNLTIDWIRGYCSGGVKLYTGRRLTSLRKVGDGRADPPEGRSRAAVPPRRRLLHPEPR